MYLNGSRRDTYTSTEHLSLFLTVIANIGVIPIANILSFTVYVNSFSPHIHRIIVLTLTLMIIIDAFYRLALFNWYCNGERLAHTPVQETRKTEILESPISIRNYTGQVFENTLVENMPAPLVN